MSFADILDGTRERHGALTAETLLADATDPAHPLHDRFEWDNSRAGHEFRLRQAQRLIQKVRVRREEMPAGLVDRPRLYHPTWVDVGGVQSRSYERLDTISEDPLRAKLLLQEAERQMRDLARRYEKLAGFVEMVQRVIEDAAA